MGKPQDLPAGVAQMRIGIGLSALTYILALLVPYGLGRAVLQASIDLISTGLVLFIALLAVGHRARFEQAFGGLCGASAFINLAALPLYNLRPASVDASGTSLTVLADFVLLVWGLSLLAHVVRHTFEVRMVVSVLISFVYFIVLSSVIAALMPVPQATVSALPVAQFAAVADSTVIIDLIVGV